jgi:hypothetical protein
MTAGLYLAQWLLIFPTERPRRLADVWRVKFDDAYRRYSEDPTADNRVDVMRVLRTFAD